MAATAEQVTVAPRLMSIHQLAAYLSISYYAARELVIFGHLPSVKLPCPRANDGRAMKRLLVRREDVDRWIDQHTEQTREP